ncbi:DNA topoisomerase 2-binding protein 1-A isoform X2 [Cataglyphis hispanica]|uniref:DNA topoisomerase 2-binding protein 1-A isoform X2 n=1 Tax=Cataglyphis hispanica TaxID=1086592 RepID=UPI00217FB958|nr:DNA topoisomerase 2-binding protein 1-A isoform X2 [Cataglyphis hispanica]
MTTQESQFECDVNIHFVVPNDQETENDCSEEMWQAFNKCCELSLEPEWVTEKICDKIKPSKNDVFIIEKFNGTLFEKLKNFKCSIVSPKCLLICFLNGEPIPEGKSPIYTTAMRGMCICVSGVTPEIKNQIQKKVEYMGGFFTKQLRSSVTHLIADSVMSEKYEGAIEMKIPIMMKEWVEAVWEQNLKKITPANDQIFDKYKCPVFKNLIVTSTNLSKYQKEEIKRLIHNHGGIFMGPLDGTKVRVVLAPENGPMSDKLKYAMDNDIACLKPDWVHESIKVGYALPFHNFIIKSVKACSTPEKSHIRETLNCSNISSIPHDKCHNNYINETYSSTISNFSTVDAIQSNFSNNAMLNILDRLSEAKSAGPFLDGCNIYLAGFPANIKDKLNRIFNVGGATRFDDISDTVTHVIVCDENKASAQLKAIKSGGLCPYILNIEWLEESMKLKRPAPEDRFLFKVKSETPKKNNETPASPLSQKNLQMLQRPKRPPIPLFNLEKEVELANEKDHSDLVQQYLQKTNDNWIAEYSGAKPRTPSLQNKDEGNSNNISETRSDTTQIKNAEDESSVPLSQSTINEKLLRGLAFVVADFDNEDNNVKETIEMLGGRVVSKMYSGIPDYGIVPIQGASLKHTVNEIVTDLFIEDCINQERIVDVMYYHKPFSIRKSCSPLSGCVITMSMYTGTERMYLSALAKQLGAICQDMFARKANKEKNTYGSTHLVCPTPEGNKYNAAVRWKLPAVTADWLKTCAEQLTLVDETPFLVGETIAPDRSNINMSEATLQQTLANVCENRTNLAEEITTRTILTPKRHLPQITDIISIETTPLVNKRLSAVMNQSPKSPFHVSTPDSPYGQIFKSNPSPETRKGWVKWVDNFPDLQVTEPPLKRRAPSTPLSELKRQLWEKLKNADQSEKKDASNETTMRPNDDSFEKRADEEKVNQFSKDTTSTPEPINRRLDFDDKNSPVSNKSSNEINMQIAKLDQMLQQTRTPENRYSLSGESAKKYKEVPDDIQKCIIKDSQPIDAIVWEDPNHPKRLTLDKQTSGNIHGDMIEEHTDSDITEHQLPIIRRFMLSGIKDKAVCEQVIQDLGGDVSTDSKYDNSATHLLCIRLSRNEKMLGSIAAGKWLLHISYLRDCEQEGRFLDEEKYEWGNPKSEDTIPEPNGMIEQAIAAAAYKWRQRLQKELDGPFSNMVALLMVSEDKHDQFKRLIEAGGGSVTQARFEYRPPYDASSCGRRITHCFVNVKQLNQPVDWAMLASKGILCFLPQYLSDCLLAEEPLNPRDCVLPEFKKYLTLLPK